MPRSETQSFAFVPCVLRGLKLQSKSPLQFHVQVARGSIRSAWFTSNKAPTNQRGLLDTCEIDLQSGLFKWKSPFKRTQPFVRFHVGEQGTRLVFGSRESDCNGTWWVKLPEDRRFCVKGDCLLSQTGGTPEKQWNPEIRFW